MGHPQNLANFCKAHLLPKWRGLSPSIVGWLRASCVHLDPRCVFLPKFQSCYWVRIAPSTPSSPGEHTPHVEHQHTIPPGCDHAPPRRANTAMRFDTARGICHHRLLRWRGRGVPQFLQFLSRQKGMLSVSVSSRSSTLPVLGSYTSRQAWPVSPVYRFLRTRMVVVLALPSSSCWFRSRPNTISDN